MMFEGIRHICGFNDCYALNDNELVINVRTNKTIKSVTILQDDPYINGCSGTDPWDGQPCDMKLAYELKHEFVWSITLRPEFKRIQYYFKITDYQDEVGYLFEDGMYKADIFEKNVILHFFKYGWMNDADINKPPKWVENTYWYQIFPERFCRVEAPHSHKLKDWNDTKGYGRDVFYGGNIKGAMSKLEYLKDLGVTGIYFNPLFKATENHKYNIADYTIVDPDFGTNEEFAQLVKKAHSLGIKVMIDAVFNHSGLEFFAWQDVCKNGKNSPYYNWYYVNSDDFNHPGSTRDGRYFCFAYVDFMPKLNTNNIEVQQYFTDVCKGWINEWDIDGIRFDVGNEISHAFIKKLHKELKSYRKDLFLLGEIWVDSSTYLQGDEYDSIMNYPFLQSVSNFFNDKDLNAKDFRFKLDYCYSMYQKQVNKVIFNLIDSHDVDRAITRCGNDYDAFIQQLVILSTMPGSPCIYYGTEIAMEGKNDPLNRLPMPWDIIESGSKQDTFNRVSALVKMRTSNETLLGTEIVWDDTDGRLIEYKRPGAECIKVYINADKKDLIKHLESEEILFSYKYENKTLLAGGAVVTKVKVY